MGLLFKQQLGNGKKILSNRTLHIRIMWFIQCPQSIHCAKCKVLADLRIVTKAENRKIQWRLCTCCHLQFLVLLNASFLYNAVFCPCSQTILKWTARIGERCSFSKLNFPNALVQAEVSFVTYSTTTKMNRSIYVLNWFSILKINFFKQLTIIIL